MVFFPIVLFLVSTLLLLWTSAILTRLYGENLTEAFWVFGGTLYLQISSIPLLLSLFHFLTVQGFLACQVLFLLLGLILKKYRGGTFSSVGCLKTKFSRTEKILFSLSVILLSLSFLHRAFTPLFKGDELYYHASRPLYWIQNASMAPYPTINDRQMVISFGTNLIFMWPILFTKSEIIGRMVY